MSRPPNILWISFEDTNPFYGCYGDPVAHTPNLDRLASQGCRWTHCFSTSGVCAPARSAIITGMYAISIGTHHMRTTHTNEVTPELPTPYSAVVPHYVKCFPEYLRAAGYFCSNNAKTDYQFQPPITAWDQLGSDAHWRQRPDPDQPFFAVFNPTRTHESGMWPDRPRPQDPSVEHSVLPEIDAEAIQLPPYFPDTPVVREAMARMYANISHSDLYLGQLLQELEEDGLADDTVVVHWSDHGPLPRGKRWPYDSGIRVPLIVRWPGCVEAGSVSDELVSTIDLGPTALSVAGVGIPAHMQGQAFLGDQAAPARDYVHASRDRHDEAYDMVRAVRDRRFKYIRNCRPELPYLLWIPYRNRHPILREMWRLHLAGELSGPQQLMFQPRPVEELYDTHSDPHEIDNLADDPAFGNELDRMRGALDNWLREVGDLGDISEVEMVRRWYPDGEQPRTASPIFIPLCADSPGTALLTSDPFSSSCTARHRVPRSPTHATPATTPAGCCTASRWLSLRAGRHSEHVPLESVTRKARKAPPPSRSETESDAGDSRLRPAHLDGRTTAYDAFSARLPQCTGENRHVLQDLVSDSNHLLDPPRGSARRVRRGYPAATPRPIATTQRMGDRQPG